MSTVALMASMRRISTTTVLLQGSSVTPFVHAYNVTTSGFGSKLADPSPLPAGRIRVIAFSPDKKYVVLGGDVSPFLTAYEWNNITGFGAKLPDPSPAPTASIRGVKFTPAGDAVIYVYNATPWQGAFRWTGTGFGTAYTTPSAGSITTTPLRMAINPQGTTILMTQSTSLITHRRWDSSTGFGVFVGGVSIGSLVPEACDFSFTGGAQAVALPTSTSSRALKWDDTAGGNSNYSPLEPSPTVPTGTNSVAFSKSNIIFAGSQVNNNYIQVYRFNDVTGPGTKYTSPTGTAPAATTYFSAMNDDESLIAISIFSASPWIMMWPWSNVTGFGTQFAAPSILPGSGVSTSGGTIFITQ